MNPSRTYDILFLALARDCAKTLPSALQALEYFDASGLSVRAVIGENGSKDSTRYLLDHRLVSVVDTSSMGSVKNRLERMALGRQIVAEHAKTLNAKAIAVVDLDEPFMASLRADQLRGVLDRLPDVFAIAASSAPTYYDLLAFEDLNGEGFIGLDDQIRESERNPFRYYSLFRDTIYPAQKRLTINGDLWCRSAFNGLCIYNADAYRVGSYLPVDSYPFICEHITFNRSVSFSTGQRMLVDSTLVLPTPPEHGRRSLCGFVWQRAKKLPSKVWARFGGIRG